MIGTKKASDYTFCKLTFVRRKIARRIPIQVTVAATLLMTMPTAAIGQSSSYSWLPPASGKKSFGYFDPTYPTSTDPAQHLGVDIDSNANDTVASPVDGTIVTNNTKGFSADAAHLIIKENSTGIFHVLGHISSDLKPKTPVARGTPVGKIMVWIDEKGHDNSHVHWGANLNGFPAITKDMWGWGRAPSTATLVQAKERGWIDVTPYLGRKPLTSAPPPLGPVKPGFNTTATVSGATFNLPENSQMLPDGSCTEQQVTQIQTKFRLATTCVGQLTFGPTAILVFQNWERTETNPGILRAVALRKSATDLGAISAREGVQGILIDGRFFELLAVTLKGWSKRPQDPPYLRYRFDTSEVEPKLVLISNALSTRPDNPIRKDIASLSNPLRQIFKRPAWVPSSARSANSMPASSAPEPMREPANSEGVGACTMADWTGTVRSIPDLFECDTPRAITSLSQGRTAIIQVGSVRFANGKFIVTSSDRASHTKKSISDMNNRNFSWDKWLDATQSKFYSITCVFEPAAGSRLKVGQSLTTKVVLQNYSGDVAQFICI